MGEPRNKYPARARARGSYTVRGVVFRFALVPHRTPLNVGQTADNA